MEGGRELGIFNFGFWIFNWWPSVAPNLADSGGAMEGFRGSGVKGLGVKEEEWKVQGGRLKRGLSLFHWASGLKVTG